jgi:hypothetical protein
MSVTAQLGSNFTAETPRTQSFLCFRRKPSDFSVAKRDFSAISAALR